MVKRGSTALQQRSVLKPKFKHISWRAMTIAILAAVLAWGCWTYVRSRTNQAAFERKLQYQQVELDKKLQELEHSNLNAQQLHEQTLRLEAEKVELQKQVQAKKAIQKVYAERLPNPVANCGDNEYAHFIYMHESGCDTNRYNSIGCYGIGQSCPKSKIAHCGADYACQNAWFSNYAIQRYGSWEGAYNFWQNNRWW